MNKNVAVKYTFVFFAQDICIQISLKIDQVNAYLPNSPFYSDEGSEIHAFDREGFQHQREYIFFICLPM